MCSAADHKYHLHHHHHHHHHHFLYLLNNDRYLSTAFTIWFGYACWYSASTHRTGLF